MDYLHDRGSFQITTNKANKIVVFELLSQSPVNIHGANRNLKISITRVATEKQFGNNYYIANSDRYDKVMVYIDKLNKTELILGLS